MMVNAGSGHRGDTYERLLRQERLILDVTELLTEALGNSGVTRAELARRLGRTPGFVSQVLGGGRNLTLRTIADIAEALALRPSFELTPDREAVPDSAETDAPELALDASATTGSGDTSGRSGVDGR
jgi:transcriptional regulator with XRE-family HTH domain